MNYILFSMHRMWVSFSRKNQHVEIYTIIKFAFHLQCRLNNTRFWTGCYVASKLLGTLNVHKMCLYLFRGDDIVQVCLIFRLTILPNPKYIVRKVQWRKEKLLKRSWDFHSLNVVFSTIKGLEIVTGSVYWYGIKFQNGISVDNKKCVRFLVEAS